MFKIVNLLKTRNFGDDSLVLKSDQLLTEVLNLNESSFPGRYHMTDS